jgi:hypothetical protein
LGDQEKMRVALEESEGFLRELKQRGECSL